jgi:hypothetical protein
VNPQSGARDGPPAGRPAADRPSRPSGSGDEPETESERRLINILIVGFILFVIGAGLWLGDALLEARRMDECMSSGRRNCAPITVPRPPPQR